MAIIRAQAVLKHVSGLAKDNCVNTFHFTGDPDVQAVRDDINASIRAFYQTVPPNVVDSLAEFMSSSISTLDVNLYVVPGTLDETGRETPTGPPIQTYLGSAGSFSSITKMDNQNLPQEVALCVSYQGTPGPGVVQRRRRGRIYIGPLNASAVATSGIARPALGIRNVLSEAFVKLAQDVDNSAELVVYSRPYPGRGVIERPGRAPLPAIAARPAATVNVDQVWVDDEFDTQRRRGLERTGRTLISTGEA